MSVATIKPVVRTVSAKGADGFDPSLTYMFDPMHFPAPVSPLFQSVMKPAFEFGFTDAVTSLKLPVAGAKVTFQNHYYFDAFIPIIPSTDDEAQALGERAEASLKAEIPVQMERWEKEFLPRIKQLNARQAEITFDGVSGAAIPAVLDEVVEIAKELWSIHFKIVTPMLVAMQMYDELYTDLFGGDELDAQALLVGLPSESVKAGAGLSDLAAAAKAAGLDEVILSVPAEQVIETLKSAPIGEYYIAAIRDYLREYGLRQDLFDYAVPTWQEDPTIAIANIQAYLRSGHDARAEHERRLTAAVTALNAARERLAAYPEAVRGQFEAKVAAARNAYFLQEEHNFYIDQRSLALARLLFLQLGARLVGDGLLARPDDILMLSLEELKLLVTEALREEQIGAVRMLVLEREGELERAATMTPPPFVGTPPAGPPPASNPMERGLLRFFGGPPQAADAPNQLKGNPGSRGVVTGVARVARTLDEAKALQPGEILVAITTMPAWTPLFGTAAALVTETGGTLSHGAIVAREYGIPAVVGAAAATHAIRTGQTITVDGSAGVVSIGDA